MPARILIVDDNPANLELVDYLLKAAGHRTLTAKDGAEGLRRARDERPDLILCDLQMPLLNGYQVLEQLKADPALRDIPVIAVTAFSMPNDRAKALGAGFDGYLSKPIDVQTLVDDVEKHLRRELRGERSPHAH